MHETTSASDTVFESRRRFSWSALSWLVVAAFALIIAIVTRQLGWGMIAVFAGSLALLLFRARPRGVRVTLRSDSLLIEPEGAVIPLDSIESATLGGKPQAPQFASSGKSLILMHRGGVLELPASLRPDANKLYRAILGRMSPGGRRDPKAILANECRAQEEKFGVQRVWTYFPRSHLGRRPASPRASALFASLAIAGLFTMATAIAFPRNRHWNPDAAAGFSFFALLFGSLFYFWIRQVRKYPRAKVPNLPRAGLMLSPAGLWLTQDDLSGFLAWNELVDVRLDPREDWWKPMLSHRMPFVLELIIAGSRIEIWDIYDRPLPVIADAIRSLWRPPPGVAAQST